MKNQTLGMEQSLLGNMPIDEKNPTPRYIQLANRIRSLIHNGSLKVGEALPSERSIVVASQLSRITVRKALDFLATEGLLRQRHGSGTYVSDGDKRIEQSLGALSSFSQDINSLGHIPSVRILKKTLAFPSSVEMIMLGLSPDEKIFRLHRLRMADQEPLAVEMAAVPASLIPDPAMVEESLYATLARLNSLPEKALQRMHACKLPKFEAKLLDTPPGEPALYIERISRLASGRTVEFTRSYYRGDRYDFVAELTLPPHSQYSR